MVHLLIVIRSTNELDSVKPCFPNARTWNVYFVPSVRLLTGTASLAFGTTLSCPIDSKAKVHQFAPRSLNKSSLRVLKASDSTPGHRMGQVPKLFPYGRRYGRDVR